MRPIAPKLGASELAPAPSTVRSFGLARFAQSLGAPAGATVITFTVITILIVSLVAFLPLSQLHALVDRYPGYSRLEDQTAYLFDQLERFDRRGGRDEHTDIAWIGGSTTREALWSPETLADQIEAEAHKQVRVYDLASSGQLMVTSWALAQRAACNGAEVVVLGLNLNRLIKTRLINPALLFGAVPHEVSAFLEDERAKGEAVKDDAAAGLGFRTGLVRGAFIEILDASFRRLMKRRPGQPASRHWYLGEAQQEARTMASMSQIDRGAFRPFSQAEVLSRINQTVEACGGRLVVLAGTYRPELLDTSIYPQAAAAISSFADSIRAVIGDVLVIDPNASLSFKSSDFYDWGHLADEDAIRRVTKLAADELAPVVVGLSGDKS